MFELRRSRAISMLLLSFVLSSFGGCGSGKSAIPATVPVTAPALQIQPTKEIFVSDKVLEPAFTISSHGSNLYVGSQYGLLEIDPITGAKRTVAGNQFVIDAAGGLGTQVGLIPRGLFDAASSTAFVPYADGKMASVALSPSFTAPEIILPQRAMQVINFRGMTANTTQTFWMDFDGSNMHVFSQEFGKANTNQKIASVMGADGNMATSGDYLYLYTDKSGTPTRMIYRYQISTGNLTSIQQARSSPGYTLNFPLVATSSGVYWAEGINIYFLDNASNIAQQVGSVGATVTQLIVAGSFLYSLHAEYYSTVPFTLNIVVTRFDTLTWAATEMARRGGPPLQRARIAGTGAGRIFMSEDVGTGINVSEITGPNTMNQLFTLPAWSQTGMYASPTTLAIIAMSSGTTSPQIYRYNYSSSVTDHIIPVVSADYLQGVGETIFFADYQGNTGIMKLPLNMPINTPIALQPSPTVNSSWIQGGASNEGYLYWVGCQFSATGSNFQIASSLPNGSNFSVLLQTSGELRDPTIFNGRAYFLCQDSCGAPGWVVASTTLTGAGQQTEVIVGGVNPRLYQFNGHAYLTMSDGSQSSIIALDMNTWSWSNMVSQLPYTTLYLDFSNKWLYWSGVEVNIDGTARGEVARQAWIDWNHVGPKQQIEWEPVIKIHYFAGNLYYWNQGLVRVPE